MKKVSVIITTYKRSKNLLRAIESVINQTYPNIEIIVVDDNNNNSIYRIENEKRLEKYVNEYGIIYLKHECNKNGAAARNTGIKFSTGDYVCFLDDDDYFLNNRIEMLVDKLEKNDKYSGVYSSVAIKKNEKNVSVVKAIKNGNLQLEVLNQDSFFGTGSNMFFRKDIIEKIGYFDERFIRHQDMEYMVRFFEFGEIISIDEILVVKCVDDKSNIPDYKKMLMTKKLFLQKFEKIINKYSLKQKNDIYYNNYLELIMLYPDKYKELFNTITLYHKFNVFEIIVLKLKVLKRKSKFINSIYNFFKKLILKI